MDQKLAIGILAGICVLILVILLAKKYLQVVFNFLVLLYAIVATNYL